MKFFGIILFSILEAATARELQILHPKGQGDDVSAEFKALGYENEFRSECVIEVVGTDQRVAAGDRDMYNLAKYFKKRVEKSLKKQGFGPLTSSERRMLQSTGNLAVAGNATKPKPRMKITSVEIDRQRVTTAETPRDRELQALKQIGGFHYSWLLFACLYCTLDNKDGGRKLLQKTLEEEGVAEGLVQDFSKSQREYFAKSVDKGNGCIKISCDGGPVVGTSGCIGLN